MSQLDEVIEKLMELDEDSLKAQLAVQEQQIANNDDTSRSPSSLDSLDSLEEELKATPRGGYDQEKIDAGDRFFQKLNAKAYKLMCSDLFDEQIIQTQSQALLKEHLGKVAGKFKENWGTAAQALIPFLAANLQLAYPIAAILAVLIIKTISSATSETICEVWKSKVNESEISNPQASITEMTPVDKAIEA